MESILDDVLSFDEPVRTTNVSISFGGVESVDETQIEENLSDIGKIQPGADETEDLYQVHFDSLILWFLRCSFSNKLKCLHRMLQKLKDESYLDVILLSLNFRMDKMRIYSQSLPNTNYIYDIKLNDHSRTLERGFLEETHNIYITWFEKLSPHKQIETIIELLKRAGAALVDKFYDLALKLKESRKVNKSDEEDINDILMDNSLVYSKIGSQQDASKNPMMAEVERRRKIFNETLTKYSNQIMGITEKTKTPRSVKNSGKSSGKKNDAKSPKYSEKKSNSASKKNGKDSRKSNKSSRISLVSITTREKRGIGETNIVDQIQQLPVWIVKNIFNYCDQKTLKKLRAVNNYWAYIVDDMAKDRSSRKYMDNVIKKMEKNMKYKESDTSSKTERKTQKLSTSQRRMKELVGRGAIHPKLRTTNNSKAVYSTLLEKTSHEDTLNLMKSIKGYESYPRNVPNNQILLAAPTCILNELGKQPRPIHENAHMKANAEKTGASESELTDEGPKYTRKRLSVQM